ncbi:MAG TPA: hypothetical protein VKR30_04710 [Candidatus Limnocylindrales bacterium]|nr:hypothetical protein [Candidatus Limnocylindrales bacterium]
MALLWFLVGIAAVAFVTVPGLAAGTLGAIASPPPLVRAVLAAVAVVGGLWLLARALRSIEGTRSSSGDSATLATAELGHLVRGIRYVFLAAAAFAAGSGWVLGDPLPIVIGVVIAGVDLAETSFLLLVALGRG